MRPRHGQWLGGCWLDGGGGDLKGHCLPQGSLLTLQLRASSPWHCLAPTLGRVGGDGQGLAHPTYPQEDLLGPGWRLPNWCPDQLSWPAKNPSSSQKVARPTDKTRGPTSKWKGPGARSWHPVLRASSLCQFGGSHKATGPSSAVGRPPSVHGRHRPGLGVPLRRGVEQVPHSSPLPPPRTLRL